MQNLSNLTTPSLTPVVSSLGGKIDFLKRDDYAGIFNPVTNIWESLLLPLEVGSFDVRSKSSAVSEPDNKCALVNFYDLKCYFAYYPSEKRWERDFNSFTWSRKQVFIADVILYLYLSKDPHVFQAFHLATKQYLIIVFTCKVRGRVWRSEFDEMLYLGNGNLCFATHSPYYTPPRKRTNVLIAKFKVQRTVDHPDVHSLSRPIPLTPFGPISQVTCLSRFGSGRFIPDHFGLLKVPLMAVVDPRDVKTQSLTVRSRFGGELGTKPVPDFAIRIKKAVQDRSSF